jgi:endoglucanase
MMATWFRTAVVFLALGAATTNAAGAPRAADGTPPALHVSGVQIVDQAGTPIQLDGVNRSGTEYACAQGWGIFDGPSDAASIAAMATWHVHVVRVPLNEDCWLGINGVNPAYGGRNYRKAIKDYVGVIEAAGMNVVLELHWSAPGTELALGQQKMPDFDHSPSFWRTVAKAFGSDTAILFDLYNEPHDISWSCWRNGCMVDGWRAVGMQKLVSTVRATGAKNILMVGGIGWAGDLTQWQANMPSDPLVDLVASWHDYDFGSCTDQSCWQSNVDGVGGAAPVVLGEFGEIDCAHGYVDGLMDWADQQAGGVGIGYLAWTWDDWPGCNGPTLILDYTGTPTGYGIGVQAHFVARFPAPA